MILPIVEGHSEVEAIPLVLRRLLAEHNAHHVRVARPFRVRRNAVVRNGELERAIAQGIAGREGVTGVLVLLDADDDCPRQLGPELLRRAQVTTRLPVAVVLAMRETESWFLGAKESLGGVRAIRADAAAPPEPELIRGAKERLTQNMSQGSRYVAVDDQPAMAQQFDLNLARQRCPSFAKLSREVQRLVREMDPG